jgi:murein DD-endopeptidase MepM/ murein hydrolase activator NlpD
MQQKLPTARAFANSSAKLAIEYRGRNGSRWFEISPVLAGCVTFAIATASAVAIATGVYVFSKDEVLRAMLSGQARMQYAYEDRIAQLRAHIDRVAGRQLVDQDSVEAKLHELINRQVQLESRQTLVNRMTEEAMKAGLMSAERTLPQRAAPTIPSTFQALMPLPAGRADEEPRAKPTPVEPGLRSGSVELPATLAPPPAPPARLGQIDRRGMTHLIQQAQASAQAMSTRQLALLHGIELNAQNTARRMRASLEATGLDLTRFGKSAALAQQAAVPTAIGGPLIPMSRTESIEFERRLAAAETNLQETERLSRLVRALPLRRPLSRHHETTSTFGTRTDPFTRGLAMHSGLDFRASAGTPVKTTADGKVIEAGWVGGYGKMVEIDHGHGLTTRYGHLSSIEVAVGDVVRKGSVVGLVGSTGRSTGPHLHYEVRVDDEATDPMVFLRAGERAAIE